MSTCRSNFFLIAQFFHKLSMHLKRTQNYFQYFSKWHELGAIACTELGWKCWIVGAPELPVWQSNLNIMIDGFGLNKLIDWLGYCLFHFILSYLISYHLILLHFITFHFIHLIFFIFVLFYLVSYRPCFFFNELRHLHKQEMELSTLLPGLKSKKRLKINF